MDSRPEETANSAKKGPEGAAVPWFRRLSRPILFLIVSLALVGAYLAFSYSCCGISQYRFSAHHRSASITA